MIANSGYFATQWNFLKGVLPHVKLAIDCQSQSSWRNFDN